MTRHTGEKEYFELTNVEILHRNIYKIYNLGIEKEVQTCIVLLTEYFNTDCVTSHARLSCLNFT